MMMSTVPSDSPWLMSLSLPSCEAGNTSTWYLPLVRLPNSSAAQTDHLWKGSDVSYTCAHLSLVCPNALPASPAANTASKVFFQIVIVVSLVIVYCRTAMVIAPFLFAMQLADLLPVHVLPLQ